MKRFFILLITSAVLVWGIAALFIIPKSKSEQNLNKIAHNYLVNYCGSQNIDTVLIRNINYNSRLVSEGDSLGYAVFRYSAPTWDYYVCLLKDSVWYGDTVVAKDGSFKVDYFDYDFSIKAWNIVD